jgi:hypothetical protein
MLSGVSRRSLNGSEVLLNHGRLHRLKGKDKGGRLKEKAKFPCWSGAREAADAESALGGASLLEIL